jgi:hypothetical protein
VTGEERSVLLKGYSNAGSILWSPNQDELVLTLTKGDDWSNTLFSAARISFPALTLKVLIKDRDGGFDTVAWVSDHEVLLNVRGEENSFLTLNLLTGQLKVEPTMTPSPE